MTREDSSLISFAATSPERPKIASEIQATQVAERLRSSAYGLQEFMRTTNKGTTASPPGPVLMDHIHELSFKQVIAGDNAMQEAQGLAHTKFSDEVRDLDRHRVGDLAIWKENRRSTPHVVDGELSFQEANAAIWNAVCQDVLKKSTDVLTVQQRWKEASDAGRIKLVEEGATHKPPARSFADYEALRVTAQADRTAGISRAKYAMVNVESEGSAFGYTLYGAMYTNPKGCFFKTPTATYGVYFEGNKMQLQNPDGSRVPAVLLGRVRRNSEKQARVTDLSGGSDNRQLALGREDQTIATEVNQAALPSINVDMNSDKVLPPTTVGWHTVRLGETPKSIALKLFNDPGLASLVERVNNLPENPELLKGMRLQIPTPADLSAYRAELNKPVPIAVAVSLCTIAT
jgi:hypothetical protein